jgi:hypothetical protein
MDYDYIGNAKEADFVSFANQLYCMFETFPNMILIIHSDEMTDNRLLRKMFRFDLTEYCFNEKTEMLTLPINDSQIVFLFRLRPDYPCINPNEKNWNYHGDLSPLTKLCTESDKRYERIDKFNTNLYDLYKENNILSTLPSYDENELRKENVYLYARNFLGINEEKASQFSKENILSKSKLIDNCNIAMKIVTFILIIPVCCLGGGGASSGGGDCGDIMLGLLAVYTVPASIIYFILSIIIFVNNNRISSMLDIGSDMYMNEIINNLLADGSINFRIPLASIIMFPLIIIGGVICLFTSNNLF